MSQVLKQCFFYTIIGTVIQMFSGCGATDNLPFLSQSEKHVVAEENDSVTHGFETGAIEKTDEPVMVAGAFLVGLVEADLYSDESFIGIGIRIEDDNQKQIIIASSDIDFYANESEQSLPLVKHLITGKTYQYWVKAPRNKPIITLIAKISQGIHRGEISSTLSIPAYAPPIRFDGTFLLGDGQFNRLANPDCTYEQFKKVSSFTDIRASMSLPIKISFTNATIEIKLERICGVTTFVQKTRNRLLLKNSAGDLLHEQVIEPKTPSLTYSPNMDLPADEYSLVVIAGTRIQSDGKIDYDNFIIENVLLTVTEKK